MINDNIREALRGAGYEGQVSNALYDFMYDTYVHRRLSINDMCHQVMGNEGYTRFPDFWYNLPDIISGKTEFEPMERYPLWSVLAGHSPTNTIWSTVDSSVVQTTSQDAWSLVGWTPLGEFLDGQVNCTLTYVEAQDLDSQGLMASAPVGLRVDTNGHGVFWKTNNGNLQVIERYSNIRNVLYEQVAPIIGSDIGFEVSGPDVKLHINSVEVFSGTTVHTDAGYGSLFFGHTSQDNVKLIKDLRVSAGGYYAPMENHPDYEIIDGDDFSRMEYNAVSGEIWCSGTTGHTAVANTKEGIVDVCNFRGYVGHISNGGSYATFGAAFHIKSAKTYVGLRSYGGSIQLVQSINDNHTILWKSPIQDIGDYVECLVNGTDVVIIWNGQVSQVQIDPSFADGGYVGCINRFSTARARYWYGWTWTFDLQSIYDPLETSPLWDQVGGTATETDLRLVGTIVYQKTSQPNSPSMLLQRNTIPEFENGFVECTWRNNIVPTLATPSMHLIARAVSTSSFVGVSAATSGNLVLHGRSASGWTAIAQVPYPQDGDRVRFELLGNNYTLTVFRDGSIISQDTGTYGSATQAGFVGMLHGWNTSEWDGLPIWSNIGWRDYDSGSGGQD